MSADGQHYDVIVIGTGAGGGTLAYRLAPSGGLRGDQALGRRLARLADLLRGARAVLLAGRGALSGARAPRGRPDGSAGEHALSPSSDQSRAAYSTAQRRLHPSGAQAVSRAAGSHAGRAEPPNQP